MISVLLHTTQNLGDHGENKIIALNVDENMTIKELTESFIEIDTPSGDSKYFDHIELRICKDGNNG